MRHAAQRPRPRAPAAPRQRRLRISPSEAASALAVTGPVTASRPRSSSTIASARVHVRAAREGGATIGGSRVASGMDGEEFRQSLGGDQEGGSGGSASDGSRLRRNPPYNFFRRRPGSAREVPRRGPGETRALARARQSQKRLAADRRLVCLEKPGRQQRVVQFVGVTPLGSRFVHHALDRVRIERAEGRVVAAPLRRDWTACVRRSSSGASSRNAYGRALTISCAKTDGSGVSREIRRSSPRWSCGRS